MADNDRREVLVYQRTNKVDEKGETSLAPAPFKFVKFDNHPETFLEPISHIPFVLDEYVPVDPRSDGVLYNGVQIFDSLTTPWEGVHEFHFV